MEHNCAFERVNLTLIGILISNTKKLANLIENRHVTQNSKLITGNEVTQIERKKLTYLRGGQPRHICNANL